MISKKGRLVIYYAHPEHAVKATSIMFAYAAKLNNLNRENVTQVEKSNILKEIVESVQEYPLRSITVTVSKDLEELKKIGSQLYQWIARDWKYYHDYVRDPMSYSSYLENSPIRYSLFAPPAGMTYKSNVVYMYGDPLQYGELKDEKDIEMISKRFEMHKSYNAFKLVNWNTANEDKYKDLFKEAEKFGIFFSLEK